MNLIYYIDFDDEMSSLLFIGRKINRQFYGNTDDDHALNFNNIQYFKLVYIFQQNWNISKIKKHALEIHVPNN